MQMSRLSVSSARSASTIPRRSEKVWPNTSRPHPMSRTTSDRMPWSWCSDGRFQERLVIAGVVGTAVRRRWPATRGVTASTSSHTLGLQPQLEQAQLPELVPLERRELPVGVGEQLPHVLGPEQPALTGRVGRQRVAHQVEDLPLEMGDRGHREIALRPVDDLGRDDPAADRLEHALAAVGQLELGRAGGGQLHEGVVEEREAGTRASRPHAMDMLSTRLTGSSTSMTSVSRRRAASTAVCAPGADMCSRTKVRLGSASSAYRSDTIRAMSAWSRSKNAFA